MVSAEPVFGLHLADDLFDGGAAIEFPAQVRLARGRKDPRNGADRAIRRLARPLRESIKVLAAEGLIELIPNRGAVVSRQSAEELAEGFRVLATLDRLVGELAAALATYAEIAAIERMTLDLRRTVERGDRAAFFALNQSIHAALLRAARNDTLAPTHASVASRVHRARYQANLKVDRWHRAIHEHDCILCALLARDASCLGALLHDHMMATLNSVLAARKRAPASSTDES